MSGLVLVSLYADLDELKESLQIQSGETYADADIELQIETASRDVDDICGQRFFTEGEETRLFYGGRFDLSLRIGPLVSLESLHVDSARDGTYATEWEAGVDFLLEPWNGPAEQRPYTHMQIVVSAGLVFPDVRPNVRVVGVFGWDPTPAKIKTATTLLANRYLRRTRDAPFAMIPGESVAMRIARTDPDVYNLLHRYIIRPDMR